MSTVVAGLFEVFTVHPSVVPVLLGLVVIGLEIYTMIGRKFAQFAFRYWTIPYYLFLGVMLWINNMYAYVYAVYIAMQLLYEIVNGQYVIINYNEAPELRVYRQ